MPMEEIILGREQSDLKKFGKRGTAYIGKHLVKAGFDYNLTNPVFLDMAQPHVALIVGKRGSGKSFTMALMAEEVMNLPADVRDSLSVLIVDTMGIFWSMKIANDSALLQLREWGVQPKGFPVQNLVPKGFEQVYKEKHLGFDGAFSLQPSALSAGDWALTFGIQLTEPEGILLQRALKKLEGKKYGLENILKEIEGDKKSGEKERLSLENRFYGAENWGIFSDKDLRIEDIMKPGSVTILDVSLMDWAVRSLFLGFLAREIYSVRISARREEESALIAGEEKRKVPLTWIMVDEAHNFIGSERETASTGPFLTLLRQGRQPGISLVLATQRPNKLHEDAIAQADLVIAHRLTAKPDMEALSGIMQTYLLEDLRKNITDLPKTKGSAVVLDDNSERLFNVQIRMRQSWHAGSTPSALKQKG
ncbi:MAG: ATP-binding protein [Candidatus Aenigmarchaeota archaeon]|nr:ATP-binding protein [Candidatus Aenigmarchaeota archaeon]